jgi:hypothetical protein
MKRSLLVCFLLMCFLGCKKSDVTLSPIEVQVSGIVAPSVRLSLLATDVTQNNGGILDVIDQQANGISSTAIVYAGDRINITYTAFYAASSPGNDVVTIAYFYRGQQIGTTSGTLSYLNNLSFSMTVPAQ